MTTPGFDPKRFYDDCRFYADKLRGRHITSGPWWSVITRFVALFDRAEYLEKENAKLRADDNDKNDGAEPEINDDFIHNKFGYCYYEIESGKHPIIFNLFVNPQYRRQGHAKWLLHYVINEIRQTGYKGEIDIEAAPRENSIDREKLVIFYASMGLNVQKAEEK